MKTLLGLLLVMLALASWKVKAEAVAEGHAPGIRIILTDEACKFTSIVKNLPYRATWTQDGKTTEGCFGAFDGQVIAFYFADKTVAVAPFQIFKRLTGA